MPPKSCDNSNCSGSGNPKVGSSRPQAGDVFSVCMSVYAPFKSLVGVKVRWDSQSFYSASEKKGARPCIIVHVPKNQNIYTIMILASFDKSEAENVPPAFKEFLIPIPTSIGHAIGNIDHVHTTPEWERAPQYLVVIPVPCPKTVLQGRWQSHKVDAISNHKFGFYLDPTALAYLNGIMQKKLAHWNTKGKYALSREEYLNRLAQVKEAYAKTLRESATASKNCISSRMSGCKRGIASVIHSLASVPEEEDKHGDPDGWEKVPEKVGLGLFES
ncbi:hypothetical protein VNI00_013980 [Paramarasmius palmivorus]|uniref:Uncharacterized protein n=1 Tax=Paramarasmius palmivorus TaxID=297713 RepID=A0AAW0BVV2_9AGAR